MHKEKVASTFWDTIMLNEILDKAKERQGVKSDSALAELIGVKRAAVSKWRKGYSMSQESAAKIARLANEKPEKVLAAHELTQEHSPEVRQMWERIAGHAAIWLIIATGAISASALMAYSNEVVHNNIYIMLNKLKQLRPCRRRELNFARL